MKKMYQTHSLSRWSIWGRLRRASLGPVVTVGGDYPFPFLRALVPASP
jgi:hypothetical protein